MVDNVFQMSIYAVYNFSLLILEDLPFKRNNRSLVHVNEVVHSLDVAFHSLQFIDIYQYHFVIYSYTKAYINI